MARRADNPPPDGALLCERCGYVLDGLARRGACPECGMAIDASHPDGRTGSPWQAAPGITSWANTVAFVLQRPRACWRQVRVERKRSLALAGVTCAASGLVAALPASALLWRAGYVRDALFLNLAGVTLGGFTLLTLTWIEKLGITFFGRRRAWRTTDEVAWAVCGHASVGWLICAAIVSVGWAMGAFLGGDWLRSTVIGPIVFSTPTPPGLAVAGAFFVGMLVFETLVYLGFRAMRYANPPGAGSKSNGGGAPDELGSEAK